MRFLSVLIDDAQFKNFSFTSLWLFFTISGRFSRGSKLKQPYFVTHFNLQCSGSGAINEARHISKTNTTLFLFPCTMSEIINCYERISVFLLHSNTFSTSAATIKRWTILFWNRWLYYFAAHHAWMLINLISRFQCIIHTNNIRLIHLIDMHDWKIKASFGSRFDFNFYVA